MFQKLKSPEYKLKKEDINKLINYATKVPSKASEIKKETTKHITTAILAAFAFVIALVWRDAIRKFVDAIVTKLKIPGTAYVHEIVVALIITIICVIGIMIVSEIGAKKEEKS
jgi:hypothetical protein